LALHPFPKKETIPGNPCTLNPQATAISLSRNTPAVHVHKKFENEATKHEQLHYRKRHFD